jgi:uncharacterized membrane protein
MTDELRELCPVEVRPVRVGHGIQDALRESFAGELSDALASGHA